MINFILLIVLLVSFITDIRSRKILNIVTIPTIFFALLFHFFTSGIHGFLFSGGGFLLGLGLLLVPFLFGGIGAGDVKLLAAVGALKGAVFVFHAFIYICLTGGLLAMFVLMKRKELLTSFQRIFLFTKLKTLDELNKEEIHKALPYGVPIVIGTIINLGIELM